MTDKLELILIFVAVIIGVISAGYFYQSSGIFLETLKRPLKLIAGGMLIIATGVLLAAFISYESNQGVGLYVYGYPLTTIFYILYIIGSVMIAWGASKFTHRPKPVAAAV